jgi:hypothetical protein
VGWLDGRLILFLIDWSICVWSTWPIDGLTWVTYFLLPPHTERTFLAWLNMSVTLASISVAILAYVRPPSLSPTLRPVPSCRTHTSVPADDRSSCSRQANPSLPTNRPTNDPSSINTPQIRGPQ